MASSGPVTPASPKVLKVKESRPGVPLYGCGEYLQDFRSLNVSLARNTTDEQIPEHVQLFLSSGPVDRFEKTITHYKDSLRAIFDKVPKEIEVIHTSTTPQGQEVTTLTPNYLCLQCSAITTAAGRIEHGKEILHRFCMAIFADDGCAR